MPTPDRLELALRAACSHPHVAAAYLYGSVARGVATGLSDVDVAVLPVAGLTTLQRRALVTALLDAARGQGLTVDLRLMDELPLAVRGRVLRDGRRLVDGDPVERVRAEVATRMAYHDFLAFEGAGTRAWVKAVRERLDDG